MTTTIRAIQFAHVRYYITAEFCLSVFSDHSYLLLDINRSHGPNYRRIARLFGYDDHVRYAKHHDLTHHWICEQDVGVSPTLHGEAVGTPYPQAEGEEAVVNAAQRVWAFDRSGQPQVDDDALVIAARMGSDWREQLQPLFDLLDGVE